MICHPVVRGPSEQNQPLYFGPLSQGNSWYDGRGRKEIPTASLNRFCRKAKRMAISSVSQDSEGTAGRALTTADDELCINRDRQLEDTHTVNTTESKNRDNTRYERHVTSRGHQIRPFLTSKWRISGTALTASETCILVVQKNAATVVAFLFGWSCANDSKQSRFCVFWEIDSNTLKNERPQSK